MTARQVKGGSYGFRVQRGGTCLIFYPRVRGFGDPNGGGFGAGFLSYPRMLHGPEYNRHQ